MMKVIMRIQVSLYQKYKIASDIRFQGNDTILMVDPNERAAMRILSMRKRNKRSRVEKVKVDPEWLKDLMKKRRKTTEEDEELVDFTAETKKEEDHMKNSMVHPDENGSEQLKKQLLNDYLEHIKAMTGNLKLKMYKLLIRLVHNTSVENYSKLSPERITSLSILEEEIINFILNNDRNSFFDVMKIWIHFEFNEK